MDYKEIGRNIKAARSRKGIKQHQLAEAVKVSSEHISHVECASNKPSLELLIKIANALKIDINEILGENVEFRPLMGVDEELNELFRVASPALRMQCKHICCAALKYGKF